MNQPPDSTPPASPDDPFMGPAVPPRSDESADGDLPEPLAPFLGGLDGVDLERAVPEQGGADAGDDFPWLVPGDRPPTSGAGQTDAAGEAPSYLGGVPEVDIDGEPEPVELDGPAVEPGSADSAIPEVEAKEPVAEPWAEAPGSETAGEAARPASAPGAGSPSGDYGDDLADWESALAGMGEQEAIPIENLAGPAAQGHGDPEPVTPNLTGAGAGAGAAHAASRDLHVEQAGGFREAGTAVAHEVADRLERIAYSLRVRGPGDLLSGAADPLEILVIGYILGARSAGESAGEARPSL